MFVKYITSALYELRSNFIDILKSELLHEIIICT